MDLTALFVDVDDHGQLFRDGLERRLLEDDTRQRRRDTHLSMSEIMTILIAFPFSNYRTFKHFYLHLLTHHRREFPHLPTYHRLVALIPRATMPPFAYLMMRCLGQVTGIGFVDSTPIRVCSHKRINRHKVFKGIAARGKSTVGWFYGFKLHLIINDRGERLAFNLTPGNVDDRQPVPTMAHGLWGKLYGDKGYLSQELFERLLERGVKLVTSIRKNMKNKLMELEEKLLLRKRSLIETVNDPLKNVCQVEHTRHRSQGNFLTHLIAGLIAYAKQPKKPSLRFDNRNQEPDLLLA